MRDMKYWCVVYDKNQNHLTKTYHGEGYGLGVKLEVSNHIINIQP